MLDKNHRPLLYSDRKHSWNDPSASLIFLGMALMIKCRFAFPCAFAACSAIPRACWLMKITDHCCTVITGIADLTMLILVRCKLADSPAVVARADDCLVWFGAGNELQNLKQYRGERKSPQSIMTRCV